VVSEWVRLRSHLKERPPPLIPGGGCGPQRRRHLSLFLSWLRSRAALIFIVSSVLPDEIIIFMAPLDLNSRKLWVIGAQFVFKLRPRQLFFILFLLYAMRFNNVYDAWDSIQFKIYLLPLLQCDYLQGARHLGTSFVLHSNFKLPSQQKIYIK